jgi:hypothetical protein
MGDANYPDALAARLLHVRFALQLEAQADERR